MSCYALAACNRKWKHHSLDAKRRIWRGGIVFWFKIIFNKTSFSASLVSNDPVWPRHAQISVCLLCAYQKRKREKEKCFAGRSVHWKCRCNRFYSVWFLNGLCASLPLVFFIHSWFLQKGRRRFNLHKLVCNAGYTFTTLKQWNG